MTPTEVKHSESVALSMAKRNEEARIRADQQLRELRRRRAAGEPLDYADEFRLQQLEARC